MPRRIAALCLMHHNGGVKLHTTLRADTAAWLSSACLLLLACAPVDPEPAAFAARVSHSPAPTPSAEPNLVLDSAGYPVLSWISEDSASKTAALQFSRFDGDRWLPPVEISRGQTWFVNWADFPSLLPLTDRHWAAHWLVKSSGKPYAYDVVVAQSFDGGQTWAEAIKPHTDQTQTEHGFVSLFPHGDGVGVAWLDGRNTQHHSGGMTLRTTVLGPEGQLIHEQELDGLVCDCCQTAAAPLEDGTLLAYRNRTETEIRDIYVSRLQGDTWTPGKPAARDNWNIGGCPVNGPSVSTRADRVALVWFTMADERPRVRMAWSQDAGHTFSPPLDVDASTPLGRVDVQLQTPDSAVVSWLRQVGAQEAHIVVKRINADGTGGPDRVVTNTLASRISGFPQLVLYKERALVAWTAAQDRRTRVMLATVALDTL